MRPLYPSATEHADPTTRGGSRPVLGRWRAGLAVIALLGFFGTALHGRAADGSGDITIAILSPEEQFAALADLCTLELAKRPGFATLERVSLREIEKEWKTSSDGAAPSGLEGAAYAVLLSTAGPQAGSGGLVRVIDTRSSVTLMFFPLTPGNQDPKTVAKGMGDTIATRIGRFQGADARKLVPVVLGTVSFPANRRPNSVLIERQLATLIHQGMAGGAGLAVMERRKLSNVALETALLNKSSSDYWSAAWNVYAELRHLEGDALEARVVCVAGGRTLSRAVMGSANDLPGLSAGMVAAVSELLERGEGKNGEPVDRKKEIQGLLDMANFAGIAVLGEAGMAEQADLLEAALLLGADPRLAGPPILAYCHDQIRRYTRNGNATVSEALDHALRQLDVMRRLPSGKPPQHWKLDEHLHEILELIEQAKMLPAASVRERLDALLPSVREEVAIMRAVGMCTSFQTVYAPILESDPSHVLRKYEQAMAAMGPDRLAIDRELQSDPQGKSRLLDEYFSRVSWLAKSGALSLHASRNGENKTALQSMADAWCSGLAASTNLNTRVWGKALGWTQAFLKSSSTAERLQVLQGVYAFLGNGLGDTPAGLDTRLLDPLLPLIAFSSAYDDPALGEARQKVFVPLLARARCLTPQFLQAVHNPNDFLRGLSENIRYGHFQYLHGNFCSGDNRIFPTWPEPHKRYKEWIPGTGSPDADNPAYTALWQAFNSNPMRPKPRNWPGSRDFEVMFLNQNPNWASRTAIPVADARGGIPVAALPESTLTPGDYFCLTAGDTFVSARQTSGRLRALWTATGKFLDMDVPQMKVSGVRGGPERVVLLGRGPAAGNPQILCVVDLPSGKTNLITLKPNMHSLVGADEEGVYLAYAASSSELAHRGTGLYRWRWNSGELDFLYSSATQNQCPVFAELVNGRCQSVRDIMRDRKGRLMARIRKDADNRVSLAVMTSSNRWSRVSAPGLVGFMFDELSPGETITTRRGVKDAKTAKLVQETFSVWRKGHNASDARRFILGGAFCGFSGMVTALNNPIGLYSLSPDGTQVEESRTLPPVDWSRLDQDELAMMKSSIVYVSPERAVLAGFGERHICALWYGPDSGEMFKKTWRLDGDDDPAPKITASLVGTRLVAMNMNRGTTWILPLQDGAAPAPGPVNP